LSELVLWYLLACSYAKEVSTMSAGTPVQVRLPDEELGALDRYRREKLNPPTRGRALRDLARIALCADDSSDRLDNATTVNQVAKREAWAADTVKP
jgi:hypothetical protein